MFVPVPAFASVRGYYIDVWCFEVGCTLIMIMIPLVLYRRATAAAGGDIDLEY